MSTPPVNLVADRYRLVEPLGQGGMGRVWKARDEVLHRDVAIKELAPPSGLTEDERREMRERSLREARAIARLSNPNVVRVFDVLRTDGDPWIVMEYVPSRSLQDVLTTDGPVSPVRAAEIGLGVLGALRAAHRAGVMHRDVKPGNVLLGEDGRVVLTDFGLATIPGDPAVTRSGLILGSPAYIAPERAQGGHAGPKADLWSLGATLFAAVEGHSPYARTSAMATLAALASEPPPIAKSAGPLRPVLTGLLRKDPDDRITSDDADRLLRRAAGRRGRGLSLLDGVRRPRPMSDREPRTQVIPAPRPPQRPSGEVAEAAAAGAAAAAAAAGAAVTESPEAAGPTERVSGGVAAPPPTEAVPIPDERRDRISGSAPPPVPAAPARTDGVDKRKWAILALVALLALGFVLAVALLDRDTERSGHDPGAQPGPATEAPTQTSEASAAPTASVTPPANSPANPPANPPPQSPPAQSGGQGATSQPNNPAPALPAGWRPYTDQTGFKVPVPEGWTVSRGVQSYGPQVYFNGPGESQLLVDQTSTQVQNDPFADLQRKDNYAQSHFEGYQRLGAIRRVEGYFSAAADWEYLETVNGERVHVRVRNFVTSPSRQAYMIRLRLPVAEWNRAGEVNFKIITGGFVPRR